MALFRLRSRYGRLIGLAACLTGLYYFSSRPASTISSSSFSISAASVVRWSQNSDRNDVPSFEEPERPRARMPAPPLSKKHKTRNGRPPKYGSGANTRGSRSQGLQAASEKADIFPSDQGAKRTSPVEKQPPKPPPPPPGVHLPGTPGFSDPLEHQFNSWKPPDYVPRPRPARKKQPASAQSHEHDIPDPFPLLSRNPPPSLAELNLADKESKQRNGPKTHLFIGFTRNWPQLLQCVVSYLAAGWPAQEIWVVENTGVMYANRDGRLGLQNPFYMNHTQLSMLGVGVIVVSRLGLCKAMHPKQADHTGRGLIDD